MSARKSERLMNLTICLLMARRFLPREHLREAVEGYRGLSDVAFARTFERDKDELRALGIPVETGSNSALFPDEVGYRIRRDDFELPALEFDAAETAALGLAATVWEEARLAGATVRAVAKLRAAGVEPDASRLVALAPSLGADEPGFEVLWQALMQRSPVEFRYHDVARVVHPWTLTYRRGSWYLLGHDATRGEERLFKVARIQDTPSIAGQPDAYAIPPIDLQARVDAALAPAAATGEALVAIAEGAAPDLRQRARPADATATIGFETYLVPYAEGGDPAGDLAAYGADVIVLAPLELVAAVIDRLRFTAGGAA